MDDYQGMGLIYIISEKNRKIYTFTICLYANAEKNYKKSDFRFRIDLLFAFCTVCIKSNTPTWQKKYFSKVVLKP